MTPTVEEALALAESIVRTPHPNDEHVMHVMALRALAQAFRERDKLIQDFRDGVKENEKLVRELRSENARQHEEIEAHLTELQEESRLNKRLIESRKQTEAMVFGLREVVEASIELVVLSKALISERKSSWGYDDVHANISRIEKALTRYDALTKESGRENNL